MLFCFEQRKVPDTNDHGNTGSTDSNGNPSSNQDKVIVLFVTSPKVIVLQDPNTGTYILGDT